MAINPGYMGIVSIGDVSLYVNDCSIAAKQEVQIPDMVMGSFAHVANAPGKIEIGGSCSGPLTMDFGSQLWTLAYKRDACGLLTSSSCYIKYFCDGAGGTNHKSFSGIIVNSLKISCAAGDLAQFSLDVMGSSLEEGGSAGTGNEYKQLMTWDQVSVTGPGSSEGVASFEVNIANNCTAQYSLPHDGTSVNLLPYQIVPGLRTITGSISVYNIPAAGGWLTSVGSGYDPAGGAGITIGIGGITLNNIILHRPVPALQVGPIITTIPFTCVDKANG